MQIVSSLSPAVTAREQAIADLTALRAAVGLALSEMSGMTLGYVLLYNSLDRLYNLGDELQDGTINLINAEDAEILAQDAAKLGEQISSVFKPGGSGFPTTARLYLARAFCLRADISLRQLARARPKWWSLKREHVNPHSCSYLRSLSKYLRVMARNGAFESPRS